MKRLPDTSPFGGRKPTISHKTFDAKYDTQVYENPSTDGSI